jgi:hypothetical protein
MSCGFDKPTNQFSRSSKKTGQKHSYCKLCQREATKRSSRNRILDRLEIDVKNWDTIELVSEIKYLTEKLAILLDEREKRP